MKPPPDVSNPSTVDSEQPAQLMIENETQNVVSEQPQTTVTTTTATTTTIMLSAANTTTSTTSPAVTPKLEPQARVMTAPQQIQQAPLALTTQSSQRTPTQISTQPSPATVSLSINPLTSVPTAINSTITASSTPTSATIVTGLPSTTASVVTGTPSGVSATQLSQLHPQATKSQQIILSSTSATTPGIATVHQATAQQLGLTGATSQTGPTALVIIPQHSGATLGSPAQQSAALAAAKATATIATSGAATGISVTAAHVAAIQQPTTQGNQIHLATPATNNHVPIPATSIPINAHQQPTTPIGQVATSTLTSANRTLSNLPLQPKTTSASVSKADSQQVSFICCLLDNGFRCDKTAGTSTYSARIQKIVATKKLNFCIEPSVRHTYICEHHRAIITAAKKTTSARENKSRNYNASNNNQNTPNQQSNSNFNDLSARQQINIEAITHQNSVTHNHTGIMNNASIRQGNQVTYSHYPVAHPNQLGSMDVMMSTSFDAAGGDNIAQRSGGVDVDLQQLQVNTLRRYKKHFRVQTRPGLNKLQLAEVLKCHFRTLPIIEKEAITYFVYIVKCYRNKLDQNPKAE